MPVGLPIEVAVGGAVAMMQIAPGRLSEDRPPTQSSWPAPSPAARCWQATFRICVPSPSTPGTSRSSDPDRSWARRGHPVRALRNGGGLAALLSPPGVHARRRDTGPGRPPDRPLGRRVPAVNRLLPSRRQRVRPGGDDRLTAFGVRRRSCRRPAPSERGGGGVGRL